MLYYLYLQFLSKNADEMPSDRVSSLWRCLKKLIYKQQNHQYANIFGRGLYSVYGLNHVSKCQIKCFKFNIYVYAWLSFMKICINFYIMCHLCVDPHITCCTDGYAHIIDESARRKWVKQSNLIDNGSWALSF